MAFHETQTRESTSRFAPLSNPLGFFPPVLPQLCSALLRKSHFLRRFPKKHLNVAYCFEQQPRGTRKSSATGVWDRHGVHPCPFELRFNTRTVRPCTSLLRSRSHCVQCDLLPRNGVYRIAAIRIPPSIPFSGPPNPSCCIVFTCRLKLCGVVVVVEEDRYRHLDTPHGAKWWWWWENSPH